MAGWGRWQPGPLPENEGGWSIPEAAGARGCLLGCASPTRGSFVWGSNPSWGEGRKGTRKVRDGGAQPDPQRASSRPWRAGLRLGGGPLEVGPTPSLVQWDSLGGDLPRQVGDGPWLERDKCPEKHMVQGGSRNMCSTVHGSYQLSTDPLNPP